MGQKLAIVSDDWFIIWAMCLKAGKWSFASSLSCAFAKLGRFYGKSKQGEQEVDNGTSGNIILRVGRTAVDKR